MSAFAKRMPTTHAISSHGFPDFIPNLLESIDAKPLDSACGLFGNWIALIQDHAPVVLPIRTD